MIAFVFGYVGIGLSAAGLALLARVVFGPAITIEWAWRRVAAPVEALDVELPAEPDPLAEEFVALERAIAEREKIAKQATCTHTYETGGLAFFWTFGGVESCVLCGMPASKVDWSLPHHRAAVEGLRRALRADEAKANADVLHELAKRREEDRVRARASDSGFLRRSYVVAPDVDGNHGRNYSL